MIPTSPPSGRIPISNSFPPMAFGTRVKIVPAATIAAEPVKWIWYGWLALGKFHILAGQPGAGKTSIAINMAATVSRGGYGGIWPDGSLAPPGSVVIWTGEDGVADTIIPRLIAAGANMNRVWILTCTEENGRQRSFDPSMDLERLMQRVAEIGDVSLIVVDPILQVVAGDSHKNAEVRRALEPLIAFSEEHGIAILGITHVNKRSRGKDLLDRVTGSLAYTAVARIVMLAVKASPTGSAETQEACVLVRAKTNVGPSEGGFAYRVDPHAFQNGTESIRTSVLAWNSVALEGGAEEILRHVEGGDDFVATNNALAGACLLLKTVLASGGLPYPDIVAMATAERISLASLKRAKTELGIVSIKRAAQDRRAPCNYWYLPGVANDQAASLTQAPFSTPMAAPSLFDRPTASLAANKDWISALQSTAAQHTSVDSHASIAPLDPLDPVLQHCMQHCQEKFAAQRYQSNDDMVDLVDRIIEEVTDEFCREDMAAQYRDALTKINWWDRPTL